MCYRRVYGCPQLLKGLEVSALESFSFFVWIWSDPTASTSGFWEAGPSHMDLMTSELFPQLGNLFSNSCHGLPPFPVNWCDLQNKTFFLASPVILLMVQRERKHTFQLDPAPEVCHSNLHHHQAMLSSPGSCKEMGLELIVWKAA